MYTNHGYLPMFMCVLCVHMCVCVSTDGVSTWPGMMPLILSHTAVPAAQSPGGSSPWGPGRGPVTGSLMIGKRVLCPPQPRITFLQVW